jgi:hypothetical protein
MPRERSRNLCVDGIPVGPGYGVQGEEVASPVYLGAPNVLAMEPRPRTVWWLIRYTGAKWVHVRQLPLDAVISFDRGDTHYVYWSRS